MSLKICSRGHLTGYRHCPRCMPMPGHISMYDPPVTKLETKAVLNRAYGKFAQEGVVKSSLWIRLKARMRQIYDRWLFRRLGPKFTVTALQTLARW